MLGEIQSLNFMVFGNSESNDHINDFENYQCTHNGKHPRYPYADKLVQELMRIAWYDPGKLFYEDGTRIPVHLLDEDTRRAVASVEDEIEDGKRTQYVKMCDKKGAGELLGKYLKMWTDKTEHSGALTLEQLVCGDGRIESGESGGGAEDQRVA